MGRTSARLTITSALPSTRLIAQPRETMRAKSSTESGLCRSQPNWPTWVMLGSPSCQSAVSRSDPMTRRGLPSLLARRGGSGSGARAEVTMVMADARGTLDVFCASVDGRGRRKPRFRSESMARDDVHTHARTHLAVSRERVLADAESRA